jgi:hypothetical protein
MERNPNNKSEESKQRWEFIEKASKEVAEWSDSKKAEVYPRKFHTQEEAIDAATSCHISRIDFK